MSITEQIVKYATSQIPLSEVDSEVRQLAKMIGEEFAKAMREKLEIELDEFGRTDEQLEFEVNDLRDSK